MNIGMQILKIRKEKALTQEEFGKIVDVISEKEVYEIMPKSIERDKVRVY